MATAATAATAVGPGDPRFNKGPSTRIQAGGRGDVGFLIWQLRPNVRGGSMATSSGTPDLATSFAAEQLLAGLSILGAVALLVTLARAGGPCWP